jgi:hypothetical protein
MSEGTFPIQTNPQLPHMGNLLNRRWCVLFASSRKGVTAGDSMGRTPVNGRDNMEAEQAGMYV